jgi:hypothetical protein
VRVRFAYLNRAAAAASIVASSQQSSLPVRRLADQLRSDEWRSMPGHNVTAGFGDRLDFLDDGNAKAADLTPGNYATPALYLAHVAARMNAQSGLANTYAASRNPTTGKVTLARAGGSATFGLPWQSGANAARSAGKDLGFDTSANDTGSTSYEADLAMYHSREWVIVDLGAALGVEFAGFLEHNAGAGGVVTLQGNSSDAWTAPAFSQVLAADGASLRASWLGAVQTYRYWRLLVEDVQNPLGYSAGGILWFGPVYAPARGVDIGYSRGNEELTRVIRAANGAHRVNLKPTAETLKVRFSKRPTTERDAFFAMAAVAKPGVCLFLQRDVLNAAAERRTFYGSFESPITADHFLAGDGHRYTLDLGFKEALG